MAVSKKRVIKSLETLSEDLKDLLKRQYPNGYEGSITRISNAKKEPIFVFPLETEDATYLVKIPATKNSEGEYEMEPTAPQEFDNSGDDADNFGNDNEFDNDQGEDYEGDGSSKRSREASYDPDFDD
jgi:hypothetical protein